ncbi:methylated-DNA--[protein]-cysteine S-methyltransferase [Saccharopolyspora sp. NPDC047091]|uniref:methylated-DNA--[protein]-cysteine S-methyltransferase n=1 Tax=Saccharopolyspora sp. NPDC047091 TaxID=3155924 RepID=UPI0033F4F1CB
MTSDGLFDALPAADAGTLARLHDRVVTAAAAGGLLDVAYRTVPSPVGELLLAATADGLVRVAFGGTEEVLGALAERISPRVLHAPGRLDDAARQLDEYFAGRRTSFELALDRRLSRGFRRTVLARLAEVEYGRTASYAQLAAAAGSPRAVRAVGTACATNPLPIVVPCHRVVRSDGGAGGYVGGAAAKRTLLDLENRSE